MGRATKNYYALGTHVTLSVEASRPDPALARAARLIGDYEALLSANSASSEVSRINQAAGAEPVLVNPIAYRLIRDAVVISRSKKGFNAAIGPLVQLWRIGFDDAHRPDPKAIASCLELTDPTQIKLDDARRSVFLRHPGMRLDLGAIAKGYIADAIKQAWQDEGVESGVIDLGGNILTVGPGPRPGEYWHIGVQKPFAERGRPLGVLRLPPCSVVTSGIYERSLTTPQGSWHHILDPRTGYPLQTDLLAVTAIAAVSTTAEIWSTIGFFNGPQATAKLIPPGLRIGFVFVFEDRTVLVGLETLGVTFTLTETSHAVVSLS